ncbi:uncharacterized protein LOC143265417 isoform X1 [Megachile rotundata]|uniref:uncharacterized protein LOC143265417 isoform X1 n=1 Tax=Megachile rotundata TaxID=143995 RepID=UPI003FD445E4
MLVTPAYIYGYKFFQVENFISRQHINVPIHSVERQQGSLALVENFLYRQHINVPIHSVERQQGSLALVENFISREHINVSIHPVERQQGSLALVILVTSKPYWFCLITMDINSSR